MGDSPTYRQGDPVNSQLAGLAVDVKGSQAVVYRILKNHGPLSDEQIADYNDEMNYSTYDPSRLRHGRKDLADQGYVKKVGDTMTKRHRNTALWDIDAPDGALF